MMRFLLPLALVATPLAAQGGDPYARIPLESAGGPADRLAGYLRTLAASPRDVEALTGAGAAALEVGDANAAIGFYARADGLSPRDGRIKAGLGRALLRMGKAREASRLFGDAVSLNVPEASIASDRGLAWDLRGDPKRAQRDYALARAGGAGDDETVRRLALSMGISGDRTGAIQLLTPLLYRNDAGAWRARAFILAMTGDAPGAGAIAQSVMPAGQARAMEPFFARLAALSDEQKARAVHLGEMPSDGTRYTASELAGFGGPRAGGYRPETRTTAVAPPAGTQMPPRPTAAWLRERARLLRNPPRTADPLAIVGDEAAPIRPARGAASARLAARTGREVQAVLDAPSVAPARAEPESGVPTRNIATTRLAARVPVRTLAPAPAPRLKTAVVDEEADLPKAAASRGRKPAAGAKADAQAPVAKARPGDEPAKAKDDSRVAKGKAAKDEPATKTAARGRDRVKDEPATKTAAKGKAGAKDADDADAKPARGRKGEPASAERIWVQVAGGANRDDLPKAWSAAQARAGATLKGRTASTTKARATNRVLVGPFKTDDEAQALVNKLPGAFIVRTDKGQTVDKLTAK